MELAPRSRAASSRGAVQLDDHGIDGQDHKGQIVIYHAQHHGPLGIHHGEILQLRAENVVIQADEADFFKQLVQQPVIFRMVIQE